jgi:cysteine-rich repeat protein
MLVGVKRLAWLLLLAGCTPEPDEPAPWAFGCGDGVVDPDEACDDGAANSDTTPGACRTTCLAAGCGDAVVDPGEGCDDGAAFGGDGCGADCVVETGVGEAEPNDGPADAPDAGARINGALVAKDTDCWGISLAQCDAVSLAEVAPCDASVRLSLRAPDGDLRAVGSPGADGCARLDPADQPAARWCEPGRWAVCVDAIRGLPGS